MEIVREARRRREEIERLSKEVKMQKLERMSF